jgi:DNA polymerase-3 subunit delta'
VASHRGRNKVVLITPADAMNVAASNALLKTLEEPPAGTRFILVTARPGQLPATIRSRCQVLALQAPEPALALSWLCDQSGAPSQAASEALAAAGGAPRIALELLQPDQQAILKSTLDTLAALPESSSMDAAAGLASLEPVQWIHPLQCWLSDLIRVQSGGRARFYPSRQQRFEQLVRRARLADLLDLESWLRQLRRLSQHPLNARLLVEDALMRYVHAIARA